MSYVQGKYEENNLFSQALQRKICAFHRLHSKI